MCWASAKREPACRCCIAQWGCCQLGGKWELVRAEMGRMSWERGLQSTAPARRRGRCFTLRLKREEPKGLCSSPVTWCPVAAGWEGGREEGRPAAQGRSGLVWCSCEPQPLWSWGLSKGRSRSRTGNPAAGSGCAGSGSVPAVQWPKAIAGDHITEPVPLGGVNTDDISGEQRCGKLLQSP